jgi:3-oxoacyl-(acyl-carrier-protein) synthase
LLMSMHNPTARPGRRPADIDVVYSAASGGVRSDRLEARALEQVFKGVKPVVVTAIKGAIGENFASGGIRSAAMALSLREGIVPPTLGLSSPITDLDVVKTNPRGMTVSHGTVNACASGGTFTTLLFGKCI